MKKVLALILALSVLQSCYHVEKRKYRSGFYLNKHEKYRSEESEFIEAKEVEFPPAEKSDLMILKPIYNDDLNSICIKSNHEVQSEINPIMSHNVRGQIVLSKKIKSKVSNKKPEPEPGKTAITVGIILMSVGALVSWFTFAGLIIFIPGLVLLILGIIKKNENKDDEDGKKEYVDVVYLKNGSIIKGMIIEQVMNTSIKIQTKDGSIFFYKTEEIEKITKEKN